MFRKRRMVSTSREHKRQNVRMPNVRKTSTQANFLESGNETEDGSDGSTNGRVALCRGASRWCGWDWATSRAIACGGGCADWCNGAP